MEILCRQILRLKNVEKIKEEICDKNIKAMEQTDYSFFSVHPWKLQREIFHH